MYQCQGFFMTCEAFCTQAQYDADTIDSNVLKFADLVVYRSIAALYRRSSRCVCLVFLTLNRSFYPSTSSTSSARADSSYNPRDIRALWSQNYDTETLSIWTPSVRETNNNLGIRSNTHSLVALDLKVGTEYGGVLASRLNSAYIRRCV